MENLNGSNLHHNCKHSNIYFGAINKLFVDSIPNRYIQIQHADFDISGTKIGETKWKIKFNATDLHDFDNFRGYGNIIEVTANNLG